MSESASGAAPEATPETTAKPKATTKPATKPAAKPAAAKAASTNSTESPSFVDDVRARVEGVVRDTWSRTSDVAGQVRTRATETSQDARARADQAREQFRTQLDQLVTSAREQTAKVSQQSRERVGDVRGRRLGEDLLDEVETAVEDLARRLLVDEPAVHDVRPAHELARLRVDGHDHDDDTVPGELAPVAEHRPPHVADADPTTIGDGKHIVIVAADFGGRLHARKKLEALRLDHPRQDRGLDVPADLELALKARVGSRELTPQAMPFDGVVDGTQQHLHGRLVLAQVIFGAELERFESACVVVATGESS